MFELPDCPGARALVEYLQQQIQLFDELEYKNEDTRTGDEYYEKGLVCRDILDKIKLVEQGGEYMSEKKDYKFPKRMKQVHLTDLKKVPYEQSPNAYLAKHRELLESRENARIEEERKAREEAKKVIVGGPADKTNP